MDDPRPHSNSVIRMAPDSIRAHLLPMLAPRAGRGGEPAKVTSTRRIAAPRPELLPGRQAPRVVRIGPSPPRFPLALATSCATWTGALADSRTAWPPFF